MALAQLTPGRPGGRPIVSGRYSSRLPDRLASKYQEAIDDSRLLELRDEIGLIDVRLSELLSQIGTGESGRRWQQLQTAHSGIKSAIASRDSALLSTALTTLASVIEGGLMEQALWGEILTVIDHRRRLVESERKRHVEMQMMITSERAMVLLAAIVGVIKTHVTEPSTLASISSSIRALVSIDVGGQSEPAG